MHKSFTTRKPVQKSCSDSTATALASSAKKRNSTTAGTVKRRSLGSIKPNSLLGSKAPAKVMLFQHCLYDRKVLIFAYLNSQSGVRLDTAKSQISWATPTSCQLPNLAKIRLKRKRLVLPQGWVCVRYVLGDLKPLLIETCRLFLQSLHGYRRAAKQTGHRLLRHLFWESKIPPLWNVWERRYPS